MKLQFDRKQSVTVELKRIPTEEERMILLGNHPELTMFDLPDDSHEDFNP